MYKIQRSAPILLIAGLSLTSLGITAPQNISQAFMPEAQFQQTYFTLVNGNTSHTGPMIHKFLSAGDASKFGGGEYTKVGLKGRIRFLEGTEGADPNFDPTDPEVLDPFHANNNHYKYYINRGPVTNTANPSPKFAHPLPPDVTHLSQLPKLVLLGLDPLSEHDNLAGYSNSGGVNTNDPWVATLAQFPETLAALEWARYLDVPISFETFRMFNQGGSPKGEGIDVNCLFEAYDFGGHLFPIGSPEHRLLAKYQCSWDASDFCTPDDDPRDFDSAGIGFSPFITFATPTMADPDLSEDMAEADPALQELMGDRLYYQDYCHRNLNDALTQLLTIAADAEDPVTGQKRYRSSSGGGLIAGFSLESEIKIPAHWDRGNNMNPPRKVPVHPDYAPTGETMVNRPFCEDYHPVTIRMFQNYLADLFGDSHPNVDSNGDGRTFWSEFKDDYMASGWKDSQVDHPHELADFNSWHTIDAPRKYPEDASVPRTRLWHEWLNFRAQLVAQTIENYVSWWHKAGVPASRIFTHQSPAKAATSFSRSKNDNREHLDEWPSIVVSGAYAGINGYTVVDMLSNKNLLNQLHRRDDGWCSPEWCPNRKHPNGSNGTHPSASDLQDVIEASWETRGHVMHYHGWNKVAYAPYDRTKVWERLEDDDALIVGWSYPNITETNQFISSSLGASAYLEWSATTADPAFSADLHPYLLLSMSRWIQSAANDGPYKSLKVEFQNAPGGIWHQAVADVVPDGTTKPFWVVMDMEEEASPEWSGSIHGLRIYPFTQSTQRVLLHQIHIAKQSTWTEETQALMVAKQAIPRPALPSLYSISPGAFEFSQHIASLFHMDPNLANLVVYGTEPVGDQFTNFDYQGNFHPVNTTIGGVLLEHSIAATPPSFLGDRKTGRFRQLGLPSGNDPLILSFFMGLDEPFLNPVNDGVRFSIKVRRHTGVGVRELNEVFSGQWFDETSWSPMQIVDLSDYKGEKVDILFETHAGTNSRRDSAVWGNPTLYSAPPIADFTTSDISNLTVSGQATVSFFDASTNVPTEWKWVILDSNDQIVATSETQDWQHTFTSPGTYGVRLNAANPSADDTTEMLGLIQVLP